MVSYWSSVLLTVAVVTRFYHIEEPNFVVWDETHFGKMANWYLARTFFLDVHPPTAKLVIAAVGRLAGLNSTEMFDRPGDTFNSSAYIWMRRSSATCGVATVLLAVSTLSQLDRSGTSAVIGATLLLFDTGFILLTRLILVDPYMMLFIMGSVRYHWSNSCGWTKRIVTGLLVGAAVSTKLTAVLTIFFIGLRVLPGLVHQLISPLIPPKVAIISCLTTAGWLGLIPLLGYLLVFGIHFAIVTTSGPFDNFFSPQLQSTLLGNSLNNQTIQLNIHYGDEIYLMNRRTGSGYLHSHNHLYPESLSDLQQVTGYTHKDSNNLWTIESGNNSSNVALNTGDVIKLRHKSTGLMLTADYQSAPLSKRNYLVGMSEDIDDPKTQWELTTSRANGVRNMVDRVKLVNVVLDCLLCVKGRQLPKWGLNQLEISCQPNRRSQDSSYWYPVTMNPMREPLITTEQLWPNFFEKLVEVNTVMLHINSRFKADLGEKSSAPLYWPFTIYGQPLMAKGLKLYLMGNPVIWWFIATMLLIFPFVYTIVCGVVKRQTACGAFWIRDFLHLSLLQEAGWFYVGWLIHYCPFFLMSRILYSHHYYPAFLFSCLFTGVFVGWILSFIPNQLRRTIVAIFSLMIVWSFTQFYPLAYGMKTDGRYGHLRWLRTWDI